MYTVQEKTAIHYALNLIHSKAKNSGEFFTKPADCGDYCQLAIGTEEREVFLVLFLNGQNELIEAEKMFYGTINAASVYPREVAKRALELNAAAVVYAHNHPSGLLEPSTADRLITERLKNALGLFDIKSLDHVIVSNNPGFYSFAQMGEI
jgi:DNA repair protein RadC